MFDFARSLVRPFAFELAQWRTARSISPKISQIKKYYALPVEKRQLIDRAELMSVLYHCVENVPYYNKTISRSLLDKIQRDPKYYIDLPVLTKDLVNEAGDQLISKVADKQKLKRMKTGGSTGSSAFFFYDKEAADWSSATTWFCRSHYERVYRNRQLHFACDFCEIRPTPYRSMQAFGEYLATNRVNIFSLNFSNGAVDNYIAELIRAKPNLVHGHPSTLHALAKRGIELPSVKLRGSFNYFESSGETLHDYQRQTIEYVFGCRVINRYGLAEAGIVAYELEAGSLQIMTHMIYPDHYGVGENEFAFTTLKNKSMPLIRYMSGDVAVIGKASENRGPFISSISGRVHDFLVIGDKKIPTHAIMDILDHRIGSVHEFQILRHRANGSFTLCVVPTFSEFDLKAARDKMEKYLGFPLEIKLVSSEELVRSGYRNKFRHLVEVD